MMFNAKYLESVGAAMADEVFNQAGDSAPESTLSDSLKHSVARITRRNQDTKTQPDEQVQAPANQEPITNCI